MGQECELVVGSERVIAGGLSIMGLRWAWCEMGGVWWVQRTMTEPIMPHHKQNYNKKLVAWLLLNFDVYTRKSESENWQMYQFRGKDDDVVIILVPETAPHVSNSGFYFAMCKNRPEVSHKH